MREDKIFLGGRTNQQIEGEKQGLGIRKEGKGHYEHQAYGARLKEPPRWIRPGQDQKSNEPDTEHRLYGHQIEEVGPQPVAVLSPLQPEAANRTIRHQV